MDDAEFRAAVLEAQQQLHLATLSVLAERIHTPDEVSTSDLIKTLDHTVKVTGLVKEDKGPSLATINLKFEYGGIQMQTVPAMPELPPVVDVQAKTVEPAPEEPPVVEDAKAQDIFDSVTSMLNTL